MNNILITILYVTIYFILCFYYSFLYKRKRKKRWDKICTFVITFYIPFLGFLLIFFIHKNEKNQKIQDIESLFFGDGERSLESIYLRKIDKNEELAIVSMEEALNLNEYGVRRKMVMDTLQDDDTIIYLDGLKKALVNEDIETSHYATAVIMEMQRKINDRLVTMEIAYRKDPNNKENEIKYEECLEKIIFSNIYDERNLLKYYEQYKQLSNQILERDEIPERYYLNRIRIDMKTGDFTNAGILCKVYEKNYQYSEDMVICYIKYCVLTCNRLKLDEFLERLRGLPVKLTQESLQYIRFLTI